MGEAIHRFRMIRDGDRVAMAVSGGKDSVTMLEILLLLQKRAPIESSVCAFTVEQGNGLRPIEPLGEYLRAAPGIDSTCSTTSPRSTCWRRSAGAWLRPVQPVSPAGILSRSCTSCGADVIAFGHTADNFTEALLRNTMFTGKLSALPPVTMSPRR